MKSPALVLLFLGTSFPVIAQETDARKEFTGAIEDNSFFIEESYNQEDRVVQHISNGYYRHSPSKDVIFSFTQEWPIFNFKHQVSYTIPFSFIDGNNVRGIGDIMINYRYQLFYKENWACFSPRVSLILPTGDHLKGMGNGVPGIQINLPASKRLSDFWVFHFNAGYTILPKAKSITIDNRETRKSLSFYSLGGSVIWLADTNLNLMLECLENFNSEVNFNGGVEYNAETIINPGFRGAVNLGNLQIVPGFSVPLFISNHEVNPGVLFYLSFEHPF